MYAIRSYYDNIQKLAEDAGRYAQILTSRCRQVSLRAGKLDDLDQNYGGRDADLEKLLTEACTLLERLRSTGLSLDQQVEAFGGQAQELAGDLKQAIAEFDVQSRFTEAVGPVLAGLRTLASTVDIADESDHLLLEQLQQRYTMMSQRQIHQQVMAGETAGSHDLGDNVELF